MGFCLLVLVEMKVLPQEIIQSPPWHPRFEEQTICPPLGFARYVPFFLSEYDYFYCE